MPGIDETKAKSLLPPFVGWLLFFACFVLLYLATVQRGVGWQDSGSFQAVALKSSEKVIAEYAEFGNLALAHPLYVAMARAMATLFGDSPAMAVNAVSSICMAVATANVWLLSLLTLARRRKLAASVAATLFGLAHMPWWMATIAEVYATSAMMLSAELLLLSFALRDWNGELLSKYGLSAREARGFAYILLAGVTGLHFSVHGFAVLAWPVYATVFVRQAVRREVSWKIVPVAVFVWMLGLMPLGSLVSARAKVTSLPEAVVNLLVGNSYSKEVLSLGQRWRGYFFANMGIFSLNFLNPAWILAGIGLFLARSRFATAGRMILAFHFVFFIRYLVADQATFAIPTILLLSLFAADGMARMKVTPKMSVLLFAAIALFPPLAYAAVDVAIHHINPSVLSKKSPAPLQDEIRYWTLPWKHNEDSAEMFAREFATNTESDAILLADITVYNAVNAYFLANPALLGDRKVFCSLEFYFKTALKRFVDRPWYVARPFPGYVPEEFLTFEYERRGSLYRMKKTNSFTR